MPGVTPGSNKPSYWDYIRTDELLALQGGIEQDETALSDAEVRFIVIHQIDELWFKLALRELHTVRDQFAADYLPESTLSSITAALRRVGTIFQMATHHFELMETMRTQDYLTFRDKLSPASGFQSAQMRQLEILMGLSDEDRAAVDQIGDYRKALRSADGGKSKALEQVEGELASGPDLRSTVMSWLIRTPILGSSPSDENDEAVVEEFIASFLAGHKEQLERTINQAVDIQALSAEHREKLRERYASHFEQARVHIEATDVEPDKRLETRRLRAAILFIESHSHLPLLSWPSQIIDALIQFEQSMLVFRQRHARMVERVIGRRIGTGGSDGVAYLDETALHYRVFTEIWAARTLLLPPDLTPEIPDKRPYGLTSEEERAEEG